ncbi:MAG TPA: DUF309 domain-containing protein [Labilithrix sp.]|nr:DUF309 domain-containing protein [Labilithrix sp.]
MSVAPEDRSALVRGARLFDRGEFFEAHDAWEERWRVTPVETERRFLQGLIQIAAALHKLLVMGSPEAAGRLFARGLAKLDASPDDCAAEHGLDLVAFREGIRRCAADLEAQSFDRAAVPRMLP